jgi:gas vesicle structural protein
MAEFISHPDDELSLSELVNRVLDRGAVISGDVTISVGGVDLVYLGLRLVLSSAETMRDRAGDER